MEERQEAEGRRQKEESVQTLMPLAMCRETRPPQGCPLVGKKNILFEMQSTKKDASLYKPLPFMGEVSLLPSAFYLLPCRLWRLDVPFVADIFIMIDAQIFDKTAKKNMIYSKSEWS